MSLKHFYIDQPSQQPETNVSSDFITKLYNICKNQDKGGSFLEFDNTSIMIGTINIISTYRDYVTKIKEHFPGLNINVGTYYVLFEDPLVESIIVNNLQSNIYPNQNYQGVIETLMVNNSGNTNNLGFRRIFTENKQVSTFNELSKLVNVKALANSEFKGCTFTSIDLTNIEYFGERALRSCAELEYFNGPNSYIGDLSLPHLRADGLSNYDVFYCYQKLQGPKVKKILDLGSCNIIGAASFTNNVYLTDIDQSVLNKITRVNSNAFKNCENLDIDINMPNCTRFESSSFGNTKISSISYIGNGAIFEGECFAGCKYLTTISDTVFENILSLGQYVFAECTALEIEELSIPNLTSLGNRAFYNTKVKKIVNLGSISTLTGFGNCSLLTTVNIPINVNSIGKEAFYNCTILQPLNLTNMVSIDDYAFKGCKLYNGILHLPNTTKLGKETFVNTGITSMYFPKLQNTNGVNGLTVPDGRDNGALHSRYSNSPTLNILYLKDITKINGGAFGGKEGNPYPTTIPRTYTNDNPYYHIIDGNRVSEFQIPFTIDTSLPRDSWGSTHYGNIKYVVINNPTPPDFWNTWWIYGGSTYAMATIYYKNTNGTEESFNRLAVPRSAINDYKSWNAFNPQYENFNGTEEEKQNLLNRTYFDVNTKIIAIESMGHFKTKADYDAANDYPDGIHSKNEYLIEEYMGLGQGESIDWDDERQNNPIPASWTAYGPNNEYA